MRARNIKPGFFDNEILGELPPLTRLLFIGLWCMSDREGRMQDRPKKIKKELLGYDDVTAEDTDDMLRQLNDAGFIERYEVDGENYIQVTNFLKHQNPHMREKPSDIPAPGEEKKHCASTVQKQCNNNPMHSHGATNDVEEKENGNFDEEHHFCENADKTAILQGLHESATPGTIENTGFFDKHSTSTVLAPEKHRTSPADSLIPDSLIPESINTPLSPQGDSVTDENSNADLDVVEINHVKERRDVAGIDANTGLSLADDVTVEDTDDMDEDDGIGKENKAPAWKTAKTSQEIGFCKFWDAYPGPRKTAKLACWRKWQKIKPNEALVQQMLATLVAFANSPDWKKNNGQYIPAPLVWLNQGRWEDEIVEVNTGGAEQNTGTRSYTAGFRSSGDY